MNRLDYIRPFLWPFSLLYGLVVYVRNFLFDKGIFSSEKFSIPVICVGNITVGGTGKTPHVEYLIRLLQKDYKVAVLSRGYKRKTTGFYLVEPHGKVEETGDEALQIKQKFPEILFAVEADRRKGIRKLRDEYQAEIVILDDAFQHRKVTPGLSIVLLDSNRLPRQDSFLPSGNLRDGLYSMKRADITLLTKLSAPLEENEKKRILSDNKASRQAFATRFAYGVPSDIFSGEKLDRELKECDVLLVTGLANPKPLEDYLHTKAKNVQALTFPDHHAYNVRDLAQIEKAFDELRGEKKIIVTTEKDQVKLQKLISQQEQQKWYVIGIEVLFEEEEQKAFDGLIRDYLKSYE